MSKLKVQSTVRSSEIVFTAREIGLSMPTCDVVSEILETTVLLANLGDALVTTKWPGYQQSFFDPFTIHKALPPPTETAFGSHNPICVVSVTYARTHCFHCEKTIENHAEREGSDVTRAR